MKLLLQWFIVVLVFFLNSVSYAEDRSYCPHNEGASIVGSFFNVDRKGGGAPDYCEYHIFDKELFSDESRAINSKDDAGIKKKKSSYRVLYKTFDGDKFAQKTLDFSTGFNTPLVDQIDIRKGEIRRAFIDKDDEDLWTILYRKTSGSDEDISIVKKSDIDVNDAGFVYRVRSHWQEILNGETIKFDFLSVPHGKTIKMSANLISPKQCEKGKKTKSDASLVCIKVSISNFIFRLIAPALWLTFDSETQQLDVYRGIVNIRDPEGDNQTGSIYYEYF